MGNLIDDLQIITGIDIPVDEFGLTLHQPRIKEIAMLGEQNYFVALSVFKMNKESLGIQNPEVNSWLILQETLKQKVDGVKNLRTLITNFLQLFITSKVNLGPRSVIIDSPSGFINIEPEQFDTFQSIIAEIGGAALLVPQEEVFKPANKRAAEIAEKMKKARKRLAAQQPKAKTEGFLARYVRAIATVTSNSLADAGELTLLQLNELMQTYLAKEAYDLEIQSRLAGAKGDNKLVHWMVRNDVQENDSIGTL